MRQERVRGLECSVCVHVRVCMHVDNGNIYMNGPCIALHRHNSSDLEPSPAQKRDTNTRLRYCMCMCVHFI